jgi:hypothetical protein
MDDDDFDPWLDFQLCLISAIFFNFLIWLGCQYWVWIMVVYG